MTLESSKKARRGYDFISDEYDNALAKKRYCGPLEIFNSVARHTSLSDIGRILDLGAGTGLLSQVFRDQSYSDYIAGVDISPKMLDYAYHKRIFNQLYELDLTEDDLPFNDNSFDLSVSSGAFEFLEIIEPAIDEMIRVTKPDGLISFTTMKGRSLLPNLISPVSRWLVNVSGYESLNYQSYIRSSDEVTELLTSKGCEVLETKTFSGYRNYGGSIDYNLHVAKPG